MGKLISGINGPIVGKVGAVVGSSWKGIPYLKGPYKPRTKTISDKEKGNRARFKVAQMWLKPILNFVRVGFKGYTPTVEGFVAAKSYLMKNAMEGSGADSTVNHSKMLVSYGDLPLSENITVKLIEGNMLEFSWDITPVGPGRDKDQVMMLAYNIEKKIPKGTTTGEFRKKGTDILRLHDAKGTFHIYAAFVAADRTSQSNSVYLGEITV